MTDLLFSGSRNWRKVGETEYRTVSDYSELLPAYVVNADIDTVYLATPSGKNYMIYLNGQDWPIEEYRSCSPTK